MGFLLRSIAFSLCICAYSFVYAQPANDNCANSIGLTVDGGCTNGTTNGGGFEGGEATGCFASGAGCNIDQSTWHSFNSGTSTSLWLDLAATNSANCIGGYAVYGPFAAPSCLPTTGNQIVCESTIPNVGGTMLTGLSPNSTYMIQVVGRSGGGSGDRFLDYCIGLESPDNCSTCSSPCGAACGFNTVPTVAQVTSSCPIFDLSPHLSDGQTGTWCYTMTAVATSVDFGMIINQIGCAGGNIVTMDWEVYNQGSCTGPVTSGSFPTLTATGLTVGTNYTFCYTLEVAASCIHTGHYPFWVGAVPLPMDLSVFESVVADDEVGLFWIADIEDMAEFQIERSLDGRSFEKIGTVSLDDGPGKNSIPSPYGFIGTGSTLKAAGLREFKFQDEHPAIGDNFYRIVQVSDNGELVTSEMILAKWRPQNAVSSIYPIPANDLAQLEVISNIPTECHLRLLDMKGTVILESATKLDAGKTTVEIPTNQLISGIYLVELIYGSEKVIRKLQKL